MVLDRVAEQPVQRRGRNGGGELPVDRAGRREQTLETVTGFGRDTEQRGKADKGHGPADLFEHLLLPLPVAGHQVPFIEQQDQCPAMVLGIADNLGVLFGNPLLRVQQDHRDIAAAKGRQRFEDAEFLQLLRCLALSSDTGGIDQQVVSLFVAEQGVHRITGSAGNGRYDHPVLAEQQVDQGRFADIGAPEKSEPDGIVRQVEGGRLLRQGIDQAVHQGRKTVIMLRRDDPERRHTEFVKRRQQFLLLLRPVDLVDHIEGFFADPAQQFDHFVIGRQHPLLAIQQKKNDIGLVDGGHCLAADGGDHFIGRIVVDAAGVDQDKRPVSPEDPLVVTISGHARGRVDDGFARSGNPVEQGRLADIGPADQGDDGRCSMVHDVVSPWAW